MGEQARSLSAYAEKSRFSTKVERERACSPIAPNPFERTFILTLLRAPAAIDNFNIADWRRINRANRNCVLDVAALVGQAIKRYALRYCSTLHRRQRRRVRASLPLRLHPNQRQSAANVHQPRRLY